MRSIIFSIGVSDEVIVKSFLTSPNVILADPNFIRQIVWVDVLRLLAHPCQIDWLREAFIPLPAYLWQYLEVWHDVVVECLVGLFLVTYDAF